MKDYLAHLLLALIATALFCIGISHAYVFAGSYLGQVWIGAAGVNSVIALAIAIAWKVFSEPQKDTFKGAYIPAFVVFFGSMTLALWSSGFRVPSRLPNSLSFHEIAWIFWIPFVEEWVFRGGLSVVLKRWIGVFPGIYLSAIAFSMVHGIPTVDRVLSGHIGLFVGPLILSIVCDLLVLLSGSLRPAIALHMACNSTVIIFQIFDSRWLEWLKILYQTR